MCITPQIIRPYHYVFLAGRLTNPLPSVLDTIPPTAIFCRHTTTTVLIVRTREKNKTMMIAEKREQNNK